jgi:SnoaL-like polyketide cyclase
MAARNETLTVARRYFTDLWNDQKLETVGEIFSPKFTFILPGGGQRDAHREVVADSVRRWHDGFEDYRYEVNHEALADDDTALFFTTFSGVHTGTFEWWHLGPWEPTGRPMSGYQTFAFGISEGRITSMAAVWDQANLIEQLGIDA